jgi:uncharacterized protein YndB with AHSA1/START domain
MPVSNASSSTTTATSDRELVFNRRFDAPPELVFEAWTDPNHLAHWWGPHGFTTTIQALDLKPGGVWRLTMRGPDGRDYNNRIVFLEVVKPERLVYQHEPEPGSEPVSFQTTVTFAARGSQTELTMRMLFPSAAVRDNVVSKYGAVEGAHQTLGRLAGYLPAMAVPELVLTRVFDAPRELVFAAWTERDRLQRWWGPKDFTNPVCEIDPRPGGSMRIHMRAPNGVVYPMTGTFLEIDEPRRLVFVSGALNQNGDEMFRILNTVVFEAQGDKTKLTLRARAIMATPDAPQFLSGMEIGWSLSLDRLASEVAG